MPTQVVVTVAYEDDLSFHLDSSSRRHELTNGKVDEATDRALLGEAIFALSNWEPEEIARTITSAAALFAMDAGTIGQCLDTAMVWERG